MKHIKYRAWDKLHNVMIPWEELQRAYDFYQMVVSENVVMMQYTGIRDKNGGEVYEGDILKRSNSNSLRDSYVVNWENSLSRCGFNVKGVGVLKTVEVAGNIYDKSK